MNISKKFLLLACGLLLAGGPIFAGASPERIDMYFFWGVGCPACAQQKDFLEEIKPQYPQLEVRDFEIYRQPDNLKFFEEMAADRGTVVRVVPTTFIGDEVIEGFDREAIRRAIDKHAFPDAPETEFDETRHFQLFGRTMVVTSESSLLWLTVILGLVDGINPCTLSVLFFLLAYLLAIGSRKKAVKIGLAFTLTVFLVYLIFMILILQALSLVALIGAMHQITIAIAIIALLAGLIMLKDFLWYGRWISLEIPEKAKPAIKRWVQRGTLPSAIILGFLAGLVELPCTAAIPLIYTTILAQQQIAGLSALPYLAAYNLFYIVPLLVVIGLVAFLLLKMDQAEAWRQRFKKYMRLLSGLILILLAVALLAGWI